ncbi:hypothetical protein [Sorangium sp. So ce1151]|uniref:hypothetical protein n=1 Tax=Sorangium sp. So ce1151 TaxID=3133332 RepID=UPI003F5EFEC2
MGLPVAPSGGATLARLEGALGERIASGEVEWRDPLVGSAANLDLLRERLRVESPHVLHFLGHGRVRDGKSERPALDGFRDRLLKEVDRPPGAAPPGLPMSALAQRFALRCGADTLEAEFQHAFRAAAAIPPLFAALARSLGPGVHTTLLRTPVLEQALAEHQPDRRIYAIQPDRESTVVLLREPGGARWARLAGSSPSIDPEEDIVVLRLYRGFRPDDAFSAPLLTEDDYLLGFRELEKALPPESADDILDALATEPALLMGLSLHLWDHRMLLYRLFGKRPLPRRSLAVVEPEDGERELWEKGTSLPGKEGVAVIEASAEELGAWLGAGANGGRR